MILSNLLLLVLSLYSASALASDYDGTRIANRTIDRVRLLFSFQYKTYLEQFMTYTTRRLFNCRRTHYLLPTSTKTFKIGTSRVLATTIADSDAPLLLAGGGILVPMPMWYVTARLPQNFSDLSLQNTNKHIRLTRNKPSLMVHIHLSLLPSRRFLSVSRRDGCGAVCLSFPSIGSLRSNLKWVVSFVWYLSASISS